MKKISLVMFLFFLFIRCALDITQSKISSNINSKQDLFKFYSSDTVLVSIICNSIEKSGKGKCISDVDLELSDQLDKIKYIHIETQIKKSSSDYLLNSGKSLLTLTFGIFLTNSAEVDFLFFMKDNHGTLLENTNLSSFGRVGYWGVLPVYMGFISTSFGTVLNSYRKPDHLQKYCLYENPSKIRQVMETKKEDYCKDYELFLLDSFYKIEQDFLRIIQETEKIK